MSDEPLVTIATFLSLSEAQLAKGALEAEGIDCFLADENIAGVYSAVIGGIRLQVSAEDETRARQVLPPDEAEIDAAPSKQEVCPKCGSREIRYREKAFFSSDPAHWECEACEARWVVEPD